MIPSERPSCIGSPRRGGSASGVTVGSRVRITRNGPKARASNADAGSGTAQDDRRRGGRFELSPASRIQTPRPSGARVPEHVRGEPAVGARDDRVAERALPLPGERVDAGRSRRARRPAGPRSRARRRPPRRAWARAGASPWKSCGGLARRRLDLQRHDRPRARSPRRASRVRSLRPASSTIPAATASARNGSAKIRCRDSGDGVAAEPGRRAARPSGRRGREPTSSAVGGRVRRRRRRARRARGRAASRGRARRVVRKSPGDELQVARDRPRRAELLAAAADADVEAPREHEVGDPERRARERARRRTPRPPRARAGAQRATKSPCEASTSTPYGCAAIVASTAITQSAQRRRPPCSSASTSAEVRERAHEQEERVHPAEDGLEEHDPARRHERRRERARPCARRAASRASRRPGAAAPRTPPRRGAARRARRRGARRPTRAGSGTARRPAARARP